MLGVIVLAGTAAFLLVLVTLCAVGVIPPNGAAGIRIPALLASDYAWRTGHRAAIVPTAIGTAAAAVVVLLCVLHPPIQSFGTGLELGVVVLSLLWAVIRANKAAQS
jgi:hypothetical protein